MNLDIDCRQARSVTGLQVYVGRYTNNHMFQPQVVSRTFEGYCPQTIQLR